MWEQWGDMLRDMSCGINGEIWGEICHVGAV